MRNWLYILLLAPTFCAGQIATGVRVDQVKFVSDNSVATSTLDACARQIKSRYFEGASWRDEATERVVFCLLDNGYFKATVIPEFQQLPDKNNTHHFAVTFRLNPGHKYRLEDIIFRGNAQFDPSELRSLFNVRPGDVFARIRVGEGLDQLRRFYSQHGYINFTPLPVVETDDVRNTVALTIDIDSGRQYHVGGIEFSGVSAEDAAKLKDRLELRKGDVFDGRLVTKFFQENKGILPKEATPKGSFSPVKDDVDALIFLRFDFVQSGYLRK
jgi:outer membrane protein assembly factor BamA